jgi:hypothetical protein
MGMSDSGRLNIGSVKISHDVLNNLALGGLRDPRSRHSGEAVRCAGVHAEFGRHARRQPLRVAGVLVEKEIERRRVSLVGFGR